MKNPLFFEPIYQERVWGGVGLRTFLGRTLPTSAPIGESWEIVDRPEAQSVVSRGAARGKSLRELLAEFPKEIMRPRFLPESPFPILVKWLDCRERLSLQVHPPAAVAKELNGEPKTENWYIARAEAGAGLIVGLKEGTSREHFEKAIEAQTLEEYVHRFEVVEGESILVRSGQIHAIDGGNLILEIQQNSDTTYRVYDWGRVGLDGKPRQLHVDESLASIDFDDIEPKSMKPVDGDSLLASCEEFKIEKYEMKERRRIGFAKEESPRLVHVISGEFRISGDDGVENAGTGDNCLLPYQADFEIETVQPGVLLVTSDFV